jgi:hypothetical protein
MKSTIRGGDHVFHRPTGETWVVAYVSGDYLAWCGWPSGEARVSTTRIASYVHGDGPCAIALGVWIGVHGGSVTLPNRARSNSAGMSDSRRGDDFVPRLHYRGPEGSVRSC